MLRILHTADSHVGADLPVRRGGRYRRRGEDFVASFERVLARAHEFAVDVVLHAGDLFDRSRPTAGALAAATQPLWELAQAGIPVVIVPGNHERSALPDALLLAHPLIHVVRKPQTVLLECRGVRLAVAGFPCVRRTVAARFEAAVEETGWRAARADVNILLVHQTFVGARCGPGNFLFRAGPEVVACTAVPRGFHYVAAGHVHRHQVLGAASSSGSDSLATPLPQQEGSREGRGFVDESPRSQPLPGEGRDPAPGPPIVYAGSPDRISFAELGEPKGGVLVEFADGRAQPRFVEHAVRPMELLPLDVTGLTGAAVADRVLAALRAVPADAVVQVRITGQTTRRVLTGLRLLSRIREARPDLTATVSLRGVEWLTERAAARAAQARAQSAFDVLDAPPVPRVTARRDQAGTLPAGCGTYAMYDADGRLLYVGKSLAVRTRVRSHLRATGAANHFRGWVRHCTHIEVRPAASELEALLVEAELVRRLAPPFNRQMRRWKRYCYLCAADQPHGQLTIVPEPPRGRFAFGPLRSRAQAADAVEALATYFKLAHCPAEETERRALLLPALSPARLCTRYFSDRCAGPCAGRADAQDYETRRRARDALLLGLETPETAALVQEAAELETHLDDGAAPSALARARLLQTLVTLHRHACLLRAAREHLNRPLILPGQGGPQVAATVTAAGLRLASTPTREGHVARDVGARQGCADPATTAGNTLPKAVADALCTAVQHLRRRTAP